MPALSRQRMAYADYLALPESVRAEWVDGEVVVTPSPSIEHQQAARRLANLLEVALSDLLVVEAVTVKFSGSRERIPDISVVAGPQNGPYITDTPVLVVEILAPSTRSEDTVRKSTEYLSAGVSQYWLVDLESRIIDIFENAPEGWEALARLDEDNPAAAVPIAPYGTVDLTLGQVLDG